MLTSNDRGELLLNRFCRVKALPTVILTLLALLSSLFFSNWQPVLAQEKPGQYLDIEPTDAVDRWIEFSKKSVELSQLQQTKTAELLKAANSFDVESYRKADDELSDTYEKLDAIYLDSSTIAESQAVSEAEKANARQLRQTTSENLKAAKMFSHKSSAIFYLCFGLPVQASHSARLAISLADSNSAANEQKAPLHFYSGAASFWSGEYASAEEQLKKSLELSPGLPYASYYLGDLYIAEKQPLKAIEWLNAVRAQSKSDEQKGNIDRALALAYTLNNQPKLAKQHIENARRELSSTATKEFPFIAKESIGVVNALAKNYAEAERNLSEALPGLQASPIKLGNRLEAAQAALWRSYCRHKLGNKAGAAEDRQYALSLTSEATHLLTLAQILDPVFGVKEPIAAVDHIPDKWAVLVGVGNFADPAVPRLRYPAKDAKDMQQFLINSAGFKQDHVKLLLDSDATSATIIDCLAGKWLPALAHPNDLIVLFISSHGTPAYKEIGALNSIVTYDTQLKNLFSTSMPMQSIARMIRSKLKKQHAFVVLDTCYAGGLGAPGDAAKSASNADPELLVISKKQLMISSSDSSERSWESKRYKNSIFTRQFVDTLEKNPAYDDFRKLFAQIVEKVNQEVSSDFKHKQTPKLSGSWSGKGLIDTAKITSTKEKLINK